MSTRRRASLRAALRTCALVFASLVPLAAQAQVNRAFTPRYSINAPGDIVLIGNTVVTCAASAACTTAQNGTGVNNDFNAVQVDVDGDASTFNSSTATLAVPATANVRWAGLYWSAERSTINSAPTPAARNTVRFKVPGGVYKTVTAQQFDDPAYAYSGFADVTSLVQGAGNGVYTVGNVQVAVGGTNRFGGWSLIVVYENASDPLRNLTVVDGNAVVSGTNKVLITPNGFTTPFTGAFSPRVGVVATDGDNGPGIYTGDSLKVNGTAITDARNPSNNFFNSTVSDLGANVGGRNPAYTNTLGFDVDRVAIPNGVIPNGATSAQIKLTTGGETYAVHAVTFATEVYRPNVSVTKTVRDINGGKVVSGDILEYTVVTANTGGDNAVAVILSDAIPPNTTYVTGSLVVGTGAGTGPKTDASGDDTANYDASVPSVVFRLGTGATATQGGTLSQNQSSSITFRVRVNAGVSDGTSIFNRAVVDYRENTLGGRAVSTGDAASVVTGQGTDLVIRKTASAATVLGGDTFSYQLTYRNDGPDLATGVLVRDALPQGVTFVSATTPSGWTSSTSNASGTTAVSFQKPTSSVGDMATFTIVVRATAGGLGSTTTNTATVSSETPDINASNNTADATTVIVQSVDLRLTKTVDRASANVGETVTFTIRLTNDGPGTATGVAVREALPAGLELVSATPSSGTVSGDVWTIPSLSAGASATLTLAARVTRAGPIANIAEVIASDQPDPDSSPNNGNAAEDDQATATVTGKQADLSVSKSVSNARPLIGQNVTFTVGIANAGPSVATGVVVSDRLPAGLTFVSAAPAQGTYDASTGLWTVGSLPVGGTSTLSIVATVTGAGPYVNVAQVAASDQPDPDSAPGNDEPTDDDYASATVGGAFIDLSLQKTVVPSTVRRGETATYTLTVRNDGSTNATGVAVRDALPSGLTFISATPSRGTYNSATGVWTVGSLSIDGAAVLTVTVRANADGVIVNSAQVTAANEPDIDSTPGNNVAAEDDQASIPLTVTPLADLRLSKAVSDASPVAGTNVTFTIVLANDGPSAASGIVVRDVVPAGLGFVSSSTANGSYNPATGLWTLASPIASGASATLTVTTNVPGTGPYTNLAEVIKSDQDDPDSTPGNGVATEDDYASASVGGRVIDLSLQKTAAAAAVPVGQTTTFTLVVRNDGSADATGVSVRDLLPAGLTFVSSAPTQGSYDASTGLWSVGDLAIGGSARLVLTVRVASAGAKRNSAEVVAAGQQDLDSVPDNDDATEDDQDAATVTGTQADLSLTKTVNAASPRVGDTVTFTVAVHSDGPDATDAVAVLDRLPAGYAFVSAAPSQGSYDAVTGRWTLGTLPSGTTATLTVMATVRPAGPYTNTAEIVASSQPDPDSTPGNGVAGEDDQDSATTTPIAPSADLSLVKTVDRASANVGETVTFTIRLTNDGPDTATGVAVREALPAGLELVSATPSSGTVSGDVWTIPSLSAGASATLTLAARVTRAGPIANIAEVIASDQPDPDSSPNNGNAAEDDQATATVTGKQADLSVSKSVSNARPLIGQNVTFTVGIANAGPSVATGVVVSDRLPAGLTFVSAAPAQGSYDASTGLWTVGSLPVGGTSTLSIVATVTGAGPYVNVAQVAASDQPDPDSAPGNDEPTDDDYASATVGGAFIDLSLQKTVVPSTVRRGETATYTLTVRNDGSADATGIAVTDALPAGLTFVSASAAQGTYNASTGLWSVGDLPINGAAVLTVTVRANADGVIVNSAQVTAANEPDIDSTPGNNVAAEDDQASIPLTVTPLADLRLSKAVSDASPVAGTNVTFTIVLANDGPSAASGIVVRDVVPAGLGFVSSSTANGSYNPATGLWTLAAPIASGASATLTVTTNVPDGDVYTNVAEIIASDQDDPDSTPGNGVATEDDYASASVGGRVIDLSLQKTAAAAAVPVGQTTTFTLVVRNDGSADATGVSVRDLLPAGLTFVSSAPTQGSYDASTGLWSVGDLAIGGSARLVLTVRVASAGAKRNSAEVVAAGQQDLDSVPDNDDATEDDQDAATVTGTQADLSLTKTVDVATPTVGDAVTFTVTVRNAGPDATDAVAVLDRLPAGYAFVSAAPSQGSYDAVTGRWTLGTLPSGTAATLTVMATVRPAGPYTNTAEIVASSQPDPDSTPGNGVAGEDDQDSATTTPVGVVTPKADLSLTKTVDAPAPRVGDVVTFTIRVTNDGPASATGVAVGDPLPAGLAFVAATASQGGYDATTGRWTVGAIASGATATLTIQARVTSTGTRTNVAEVIASDQPDPDSTPGNGIVGEDDRAEATVTTVGSSGGGNAGVESEGSMAILLAQRLYQRREDVAARGMLLAPPSPVAFSMSGTDATGAASVLRELVPANGPQQTAAMETTPRDLIGVTNAREVVGADYIRADGVRLAGLFGATSPGGALYDHAKATCDRLGGGRLDDVRRVMVGSRSFVLSKLIQADGAVDYAVSFVAYRVGSGFIVESKFAAGQYAPPAGTQEVLTVQVWSVSPEYTTALVASALAKLEAQGPVEYRNTADAATAIPSAYVVSGRYEGGSVVVLVRNTTGAALTLPVRGLVAATEADASANRRTAFAQTITVPVATASTPLTPVRLNVGSLFDASFTIDDATSKDQFYFADGTWSHSVGTGTVARFTTTPETRTAQPGTFLVERASSIEGTVNDYVSLFRYLRPAGAPVDLTAYSAVEFTYRSTVPVQLLVEKASVTAWNGKFVANLPANPSGGPVRVPFASLAPVGAGSARFTAGDVTMVAFYALGDRQASRSFSLAVSDVRFTGGATTAAGDAPRVTDLTLAQNSPNPASQSATIRFTLPSASPVTLVVYDLMGREVARLVDRTLDAGAHAATLDATALSSGTYVYRLVTPSGALTRTLVVAR